MQQLDTAMQQFDAVIQQLDACMQQVDSWALFVDACQHLSDSLYFIVDVPVCLLDGGIDFVDAVLHKLDEAIVFRTGISFLEYHQTKTLIMLNTKNLLQIKDEGRKASKNLQYSIAGFLLVRGLVESDATSCQIEFTNCGSLQQRFINNYSYPGRYWMSLTVYLALQDSIRS